MTFACGHLPFANAVEAVLAEAGVSVERSDWELHAGGSAHIVVNAGHMMSCLLYTSDAADDTASV